MLTLNTIHLNIHHLRKIWAQAMSDQNFLFFNHNPLLIPEDFKMIGHIDINKIFHETHIDIFNQEWLEWRLQDWCIGILDNMLFKQAQKNEDFVEPKDDLIYFIHGTSPYGSRIYQGYPDLAIIANGHKKERLFIEFKSFKSYPNAKQRRIHRELNRNPINQVEVIRSPKEFLQTLGGYFFNYENAFFSKQVFHSWLLYLHYAKFINSFGDYVVPNFQEKTYRIVCCDERFKYHPLKIGLC